jgi:hypothetical protein
VIERKSDKKTAGNGRKEAQIALQEKAIMRYSKLSMQ